MGKKTNSSSETISSGSLANKTGNSLQLFVERILQDNGYLKRSKNKQNFFDDRQTLMGKHYATQVPCGESIYGSQRKCDFLLVNTEKFPESLIIECKWQQSSGSVDEKYPFTLFNIVKIAVPTIILLDGGGYKPTAMQWLKDQVDLHPALIGVYNMAEFQSLVNTNYLG